MEASSTWPMSSMFCFFNSSLSQVSSRFTSLRCWYSILPSIIKFAHSPWRVAERFMSGTVTGCFSGLSCTLICPLVSKMAKFRSAMLKTPFNLSSSSKSLTWYFSFLRLSSRIFPFSTRRVGTPSNLRLARILARAILATTRGMRPRLRG